MFNEFIIVWVLWRELGGDWGLGVFLIVCCGREPGKRNMDLTTVFTVPKTHHIFERRTGFSDSLVPSADSLGGCWIALWCFWEASGQQGILNHGGG